MPKLTEFEYFLNSMPKSADPTPTPEPTPAPEPTPTPAPDPAPSITYTEAQYKANLAREQKAWEKKATDAEAKAKLSDDERLKADLDEARSQLRMRDTKDAVQTEAGKLGARNAALIYKAVKDDLTFDKDGKPDNLKEVLANAKTDFPELFGAASNGSADGGEGKTPTASNSLDNQIRQALGYS